jgi:hypothetical protein
MADQGPLSRLSREVLPPQKPSSGFGVLMVASLTMFFAIASSAFVLRARMVRTCPGAAQAPLVLPDQVIVQWEDRARECGTPAYRANPDGSTTVFFEVCPRGTPYGIFTVSDTLPASVEVHEIR